MVVSGLQIAAAVPCVSSPRRLCRTRAAIFGVDMKAASQLKLTSSYHISSGSARPFTWTFTCTSKKFNKVVTRLCQEQLRKGLLQDCPLISEVRDLPCISFSFALWSFVFLFLFYYYNGSIVFFLLHNSIEYI